MPITVAYHRSHNATQINCSETNVIFALCVAGTEEHAPLYRDNDLSSSSNVLHPFLIKNWRFCDKPEQQHVSEANDLDHDGVDDIKLSWLCDSNGQSKLQSIDDEEARWEEWTCWSSCKATCWGGLQTRTRQCKHGTPGKERCAGRGSESKECYFGPKCPFRVRKDASTLTESEVDDLMQAMRKYKQDTTVKGFRNAASAHGWPYQCKGQECCPHGAKMKFLSWHRSTVLNIEEGLSRYLHDKTLGVPYWNWLADNEYPPDFVWRKYVNEKENPFSNMTVRTDKNGVVRTIQRDEIPNMLSLERIHDEWLEVTATLMKSNRMLKFAESLENIHGIPHNAVCTHYRGNKCDISFGNIQYAAFDPIFILHHTQIDRLWAVAQKEIEDEGTTTWTTQSAIELGESESDFSLPQMPFGDKNLNAFPILQAVNNMRDSYYYRELTGVVYDFLGNNGFPKDEPRKVQAGPLLFLAHYLRSILGSKPVYVNYYFAFGNAACSDLTEFYRIGNSLILPTTRAHRNSVPTLIAVQKIGFGDPDAEFSVKACYTNKPNCSSNCPDSTNPSLQDLPTPALVHHIGAAEIYKFNWSPGSLMPQWPISFESSLHWIYFYGSRAKNIVQVSSVHDWHDCNSFSGRPFGCNGRQPCILSQGTIYLIDSNFYFCNDGLKMIVSAKL